MKSDDYHVNSINLLYNIGFTTRIPMLFPNDYEVWALHFEDYVLGLEDNGSLIRDAITKEWFAYTGTKRLSKLKSSTTFFFLIRKTYHRMKKIS